MQRLRTTFKRSRTPTASDMKTHSSLEVPKQVRSASFDEIQLNAKRLQQDARQSFEDYALLSLPQFSDQRAHSLDSAVPTEELGSCLDVHHPSKFQRRRSSSNKSPTCVHCVCLEEYNRTRYCRDTTNPNELPPFDLSESSSESEDEAVPECTIKVTLSPEGDLEPMNSPPPVHISPPNDHLPEDLAVNPTQARRRSIHRQQAFIREPSDSSFDGLSVPSPDLNSDDTSEGTISEGDVLSDNNQDVEVNDIYLKVPDLKRDRAVSVDSCFLHVSQNKTEEIQPSEVSLQIPSGPNTALRSGSVDIVFPTDEQARYKAFAMTAPVTTTNGEFRKSEKKDVIRSTPDWSDEAINGQHLWVPTSASGDFCYAAEVDCTRRGPRLRCSACNVVTHQNCISVLNEKMKFSCKPTFRDVGVRQYREQSSVEHHWVHRRSEKGKCKHCDKSFQSKLSFSSKEIIAISCSWCKAAYHNKESCFTNQRISEECKLGAHSNIIVPPSWIIKLPERGNFKSSLRKTSQKTGNKRRKDKSKEQRVFTVKPIPTVNVTPVIVFINPKSGGNQGIKLLQKFQWLLNPRQVFDLTQGGPKMGLELYKKVPNLRVLACGGDGTVGWVLSVIDQIGMSPPPSVGVLPLGTGNDLARALGWGGGYTDEPISKILLNIGKSETVLLDRWSLEVNKNPQALNNEDGKENLPLNVMNNYYSLGVDAHIALEFHEAREAHPEKFNSRIRNKMFYGQMGGKDLLKRKWRDLTDFVTLECDGTDITHKLRSLRVHAIVFLNIPSYGGGTRPWNKSVGTYDPSTDDGLIEVVGLTTYQLPLLQAGGHGTCITQCKSAKIVTSKTIPMQVDGEACKLAASVINLTHLNKAPMLVKKKGGKLTPRTTVLDNLTINVHKVCMSDYEQHHDDKDLMNESAISIGEITVEPNTDLEQLRLIINNLLEENKDQIQVAKEWCFIDACTAERFFRIDHAQENLHYVSDIALDNLYILEDDEGTLPQTPQDETAHPSPTSTYQGPLLTQSVSTNKGSTSHLEPKNSSEESPDPDEYIYDKQNHNDKSKEDIKIRSITERVFALNEESYIAYRTNKSNECLIGAAKSGDLQKIKELHNQGYSLLTKDAAGQTTLHHAVRYGHGDVVKYLLRYAPSIINMKDANLGQTALHHAVAYKWRNICCMLIAGGAAIQTPDNRGITPKLLALNNNDQELVSYLESQEQFHLNSSDNEIDS